METKRLMSKVLEDPPDSQGRFPLLPLGIRESFNDETLTHPFSFTKKDSDIQNFIISDFGKEEKKKSFKKVSKKVESSFLNTRRFKINPSKFLRERFRECFDFGRLIYNSCVDAYNDGRLKQWEQEYEKNPELKRVRREKNSEGVLETKEPKDKFRKFSEQMTLVKHFANPKTSCFSEEIKKKYSTVPNDICESYVKEFLAAKEACIENLKAGNIKSFKMGHRLKKEKFQESFTIRHTELNKGTKNVSLFPTKWVTSNEVLIEKLTQDILEKNPRIKKTALKSELSKELSNFKKEIVLRLPRKRGFDPKHDSKIVRTFRGRYYIDVPFDVEIQKVENNFKVISLDPGIRTFLTGYDSNGGTMSFGNIEDIKKSKREYEEAQWLNEGHFSKYDPVKKRNVKGGKAKKEFFQDKLKKEAKRLLVKSKNRIRTFHHKVAKYLVESFDAVIIPEFKTSGMVKKKNEKGEQIRKISKSTVSFSKIWSHFSFRQILINKGKKFNSKIIVGTEEYTSQTCGSCFLRHTELGGNKIFECPNCDLGFKMDRDENAARNILFLNWEFGKLRFHETSKN